MTKQTKKCTRCNSIKPLKNFSHTKRLKDGYHSVCKICSSIMQKKWRIKNAKKIKKDKQIYYQHNKEKFREERRKWYRDNLEKARELSRKESMKSYWKHKEKRLKASKKWREKNPEKMKAIKKKWKDDHKEEETKYRREYSRNKRKTDIQYRIKDNVSSSIGLRLRKRLSSKEGKSTFTFLPYTIDELIVHLENQFQKGMTWKNYGKWHIDHIKPDCQFNYTSVDDEEFQKCWALENLQPLWAKENLKKNKY